MADSKRLSRLLGVDTPIMLDDQAPNAPPSTASTAAMPHWGSVPTIGKNTAARIPSDEVHVLLCDAREQQVIHRSLCTGQVGQQPINPSAHGLPLSEGMQSWNRTTGFCTPYCDARQETLVPRPMGRHPIDGHGPA